MRFLANKNQSGIRRTLNYLAVGAVSFAVGAVALRGSGDSEAPTIAEQRQSFTENEGAYDIEVEGDGFRAQIFLDNPLLARNYGLEDTELRLKAMMYDFLGDLHAPELKGLFSRINSEALRLKREVMGEYQSGAGRNNSFGVDRDNSNNLGERA